MHQIIMPIRRQRTNLFRCYRIHIPTDKSVLVLPHSWRVPRMKGLFPAFCSYLAPGYILPYRHTILLSRGLASLLLPFSESLVHSTSWTQWRPAIAASCPLPAIQIDFNSICPIWKDSVCFSSICPAGHAENIHLRIFAAIMFCASKTYLCSTPCEALSFQARRVTFMSGSYTCLHLYS